MAYITPSNCFIENITINLEEFIAIKGIKSLGNQLTTDKIKQVNVLESLEYIPPKIKEVEVIEEEVIETLPLDIPVVEKIAASIEEKKPLIIDTAKKAPKIIKPKKKPLDDSDQHKLF